MMLRYIRCICVSQARMHNQSTWTETRVLGDHRDARSRLELSAETEPTPPFLSVKGGQYETTRKSKSLWHYNSRCHLLASVLDVEESSQRPVCQPTTPLPRFPRGRPDSEVWAGWALLTAGLK